MCIYMFFMVGSVSLLCLLSVKDMSSLPPSLPSLFLSLLFFITFFVSQCPCLCEEGGRGGGKEGQRLSVVT